MSSYDRSALRDVKAAIRKEALVALQPIDSFLSYSRIREIKFIRGIGVNL